MPRRLQDLSILIVDDNPANAELLQLMLEDEGFDNTHAMLDARLLEDWLQQHPVDLLVLDIRMPHMDGFAVMEMLNSRYSQLGIPVIVVTAEDGNRERALHMGATDFITKPFQNWEVILRITNTLQSRLYYLQAQQRADELEQLVRKRTREVEETQHEIVRRLARAGEYRDNETGMHVMRMSHMCQHLAISMGCDTDYSELLLRASSLHDVGKIGISDAILLKPGRLSDDERHIMESHTRIGFEILTDHHSALMQMAAEIALCHHEKWDGSGYPRGLAGADIPLSARIAALCDVADALLSKRPYKDAWPMEKALELLQREAGQHFDPALVDCFLHELETIKAIRARFAEQD